MARKGLNQKKCAAAERTIHDILYLDVDDKGNFHNGAKEWNVDMLERIAEALGAVMPQPPPFIECALCHVKVKEHSIHIDRDHQNICGICWDERMR